MRFPIALRPIAALVAADAAQLRRDWSTLLLLLIALGVAVAGHAALRAADQEMKAFLAAAATGSIEVPVEGDASPDIDAWLRERGIASIRAVGGAENAVRSQSAFVGLLLEADGGRTRATVLRDPQRPEAVPALRRLDAALRAYAAAVVDRRLAEHGLARADLDPLPVSTRAVAGPAPPVSILAPFLPETRAPRASLSSTAPFAYGATGLIVAVIGVMIGMSSTMDCWLVPRSRGSLDPLAGLPVRLDHLLAAKGAVAGLMAAVLALPAAAGFAWGSLRVGAPALALAIAVATTVVATAPLTCALAAAASARIRDQKWALLLGSMSAGILIALAGTIADLPPDAAWLPWLPLLGPLHAVEAAVAGAEVAWLTLAASAGGTLVLAALLLRLAAAIMPRELLLAAD